MELADLRKADSMRKECQVRGLTMITREMSTTTAWKIPACLCDVGMVYNSFSVEHHA